LRAVGRLSNGRQGLHYALAATRADVESISNADNAGLSLAKLRVEGRLRGSDAPFDAQWLLKIVCRNERACLG